MLPSILWIFLSIFKETQLFVQFYLESLEYHGLLRGLAGFGLVSFCKVALAP